MKFHEAVAMVLHEQRVDTVFGLLGDGNLYLIDSFSKKPGARFVSFAHEAGALLAAGGYSKTSGRVGVASITHGPGLTNVMTALVNSRRDHNQILVIAGDTPAGDHATFQDIPQRSFVDITGAGFVQVATPDTMPDDIRSAIRRVMAERRPIVVNVPSEFTWAEVNYSPADPVTPPAYAISPDPEALEDAVGVIASAHRPLLLAGKGATSREAREAVLALAGRIGAPVATTLQAKDLFRGEAHDLGLFGTLSDDHAISVIAKADCVVSFGAELNPYTTAGGDLLAGKRLVQVDRDPEVIGRWQRPHAGVIGDSAKVASEFLSWLEKADVATSGFLRQASPKRVGQSEISQPPDDDVVTLTTSLTMIDRHFLQDRTLTVDSGRFIQEAFRRLHVQSPDAYVHTIRFGSIGLGMGMAIGAHFGAPDRPVLLACGDGGFMLGGLTEFNTAVRHGVDLVVVVFNDGAYGAEHLALKNRGMDPDITTFDWPDLAQVATALGGKGFAVRTIGDLRRALDSIAERTVPVLIDIKLDPHEVPGHERSSRVHFKAPN